MARGSQRDTLGREGVLAFFISLGLLNIPGVYVVAIRSAWVCTNGSMLRARHPWFSESPNDLNKKK
jgi:hypothetical protein